MFETLDAFLRIRMEPLTYLAFFGLFFPLMALEFRFEHAGERTQRMRRWLPNVLLTAGNILVLGILPLSALAAADYAQEQGIGLLQIFQANPIVVILAGFLARSLVSWVIHFAMHKVPVLWRLHRVHHSDTQMDVTTTVRFHPLELAVSAPIVAGTVILLGLPPAVVMMFELFDAAIAVFSHANIRLPGWLDRTLRLVIITPLMHRIHHSSWQPETDSNYGATLSIWDRVFGTYVPAPRNGYEAMEIGLEELQDERPSNFMWLLISPLRTLSPGHTTERPGKTKKEESVHVADGNRGI